MECKRLAGGVKRGARCNYEIMVVKQRLFFIESGLYILGKFISIKQKNYYEKVDSVFIICLINRQPSFL